MYELSRGVGDDFPSCGPALDRLGVCARVGDCARVGVCARGVVRVGIVPCCDVTLCRVGRFEEVSRLEGSSFSTGSIKTEPNCNGDQPKL